MRVFKLCLHAAMFEVDGACVSICARVTLFVNDAYVFACEAADSSDLGRLLSCWKHTAAHQIFTAPSNSRLHVGSLRLAWGLLAADCQRREENISAPESKKRFKHPRKSSASWRKL